MRRRSTFSRQARQATEQVWQRLSVYNSSQELTSTVESLKGQLESESFIDSWGEIAASTKAILEIVKAEDEEGLIVIYNEIFLGLIRERAEVPPASIKRSALCNLLRQSVVTASTALETYLPILLRNNLPEVIRLRGRDFVPKNDDAFKNQFKELKFDLDEVVRILTDPDPLFVANKMISSLNFSYLNGRRGIHVTGVLLGLDNPWGLIAQQLGRAEEEVKKTLDATVKRRNDIVHRADRSQCPSGKGA